MSTSNNSAFPKPIFAEYKIDYEALHKKARQRVLDRVRPLIKEDKAVMFFQGGTQPMLYCTDKELLFRQESTFNYLFGVEEPDCLGVIDIIKGTSILFMPRLPESYAVWLGKIETAEFFKNKYRVDQVYFVDEAPKVLNELDPKTIYVLNQMKPKALNWLSVFTVNCELIEPEIDECRVFKSDEELDLMRFINKVSSNAHINVMKNCRVGMQEYELESMFLYLTYTNGRFRHIAYTCICASGKSSATLHYPNNDKQIKEGQMLLLDMGAEYHCYISDITCSFPVNGKFTEDQKAIYNIVLDAQSSVMKAMKPGIDWTDMHRLAEHVILEGLLKLGLIRGSIEDLKKNHIAALFFPHGLGHLMGLDTHDVGGYPKGLERIDEPGIRNLRTRRVLQKGMVITVEPGLYFIDANIDPALKDPITSQFLNAEILERFRDFGGVRIEDDVIN